MVWKVVLEDEEDQYEDNVSYLLIEFQSSNDKRMALRIAEYLSLLYVNLDKENQVESLIPRIYPVVLYNGRFKWKSPESAENFISPGFAERKGKRTLYDVRYECIDLLRLEEDDIPSVLTPFNAWMRLERCVDPEVACSIVRDLDKYLNKNKRLFGVFSGWS